MSLRGSRVSRDTWSLLPRGRSSGAGSGTHLLISATATSSGPRGSTKPMSRIGVGAAEVAQVWIEHDRFPRAARRRRQAAYVRPGPRAGIRPTDSMRSSRVPCTDAPGVYRGSARPGSCAVSPYTQCPLPRSSVSPRRRTLHDTQGDVAHGGRVRRHPAGRLSSLASSPGSAVRTWC